MALSASKLFKHTALGLLVLSVLGAGVGFYKLRSAGQTQVDGTLQLSGLKAPVKVMRDAAGVPYIFAENTPDLIKAQGFVTAQHRLFQAELFRATWRGELAATLGAETLPSDIRMRVLGIQRNGEKHAAKLSDGSRAFFQNYVDGMNAYIANHTSDHPIEFKTGRPSTQALDGGRPRHPGALRTLHPLHQFQGRSGGAKTHRRIGF